MPHTLDRTLHLRVIELAKRVGQSSIGPPDGTLMYIVVPPPEVDGNPAFLREPNIFERFRQTVWRIEWPDGSEEEISFHGMLALEFMVAAWDRALSQADHGARSVQLSCDVPNDITDDDAIKFLIDKMYESVDASAADRKASEN